MPRRCPRAIERDQRHEHRVEPQQRHPAQPVGFLDPPAVAAQRRVASRTARTTSRPCAGCGSSGRRAACRASRRRRSRGAGRLRRAGRGRRRCAGRAARGRAGAVRAGWRAQPPRAARRASGAAAAGSAAALRRGGRKGRGATRLCRHRPLLSTWSNIWGRPRHLRLSARGGLAQCCRLARLPRVFTLRSRGNPDRVEHRRRRQIIEGSDRAAPSTVPVADLSRAPTRCARAAT